MSSIVTAISMPKFAEYIANINDFVNTIVYHNKIFSKKILELEHRGWYDDVYKEARNQLMMLQQPTNAFILKLEELDKELITWYCELYEGYICSSNYTRPQINMQLVEVIDNQVKRDDENLFFNKDDLLDYVNSTRLYVDNIQNAIDGILKIHRNFEEFFKSSRYQDIDEELTRPIATLGELLVKMGSLARFVELKIDVIVKYQKG